MFDFADEVELWNWNRWYRNSTVSEIGIFFESDTVPVRGGEFAPAAWVQAFVYPDPGLLAEPVLSDPCGSAVRAGFGGDGVDEGDLGPAPRLVLFVKPFGDGLFGERAELG